MNTEDSLMVITGAGRGETDYVQDALSAAFAPGANGNVPAVGQRVEMVGAVRADYFQGGLERELYSFFEDHLSVQVPDAYGFGFSVHDLFFYS